MSINCVSIYSLNDPITNEPRYIGKSNKPIQRLREHLSENESTHKCNWVKSLKRQNLKPILEIIDTVSESEWQFWEKHYISLYRTWGFNLTNDSNCPGGEGNSKGYRPSLETIIKWRETKKKTIEKRGYYFTFETCRDISERMRNRVVLEETKEKMKLNHRIHNSNIPIPTRKIVLQYDLNGNFIKEWPSITNVADSIKLNKDWLSRCCNDEDRPYKESLWKFKN